MNNDKTFELIIHNRKYAIPAENIQQVVKINRSSIFSVPFYRDEKILGLFNINGKIMSIANPCREKNKDMSNTLTVAILKYEEKELGVQIDSCRWSNSSEIPELDFKKIFDGGVI